MKQTSRGLDEPQLSGPLHRLISARRAELAVDALGVALDRVERDVERRSDFPERELARQEPQHSELAVRELLGSSAPTRARRTETPLPSCEHFDEDARIRAALDRAAGLAHQRARLVVLTEVVSYLGIREQRVALLGLGDAPPRELHGTPDLNFGLLELALLLDCLPAGDVGHRVRPMIVETTLASELDGCSGELGCRLPVTALGMISGEAAVRVDDREVVAGRPGALDSLLERGGRLGWLAAPEQRDPQHGAADR